MSTTELRPVKRPTGNVVKPSWKESHLVVVRVVQNEIRKHVQFCFLGGGGDNHRMRDVKPVSVAKFLS